MFSGAALICFGADDGGGLCVAEEGGASVCVFCGVCAGDVFCCVMAEMGARATANRKVILAVINFIAVELSPSRPDFISCHPAFAIGNRFITNNADFT